jgi:hypothetical protein
MRSVPELKLTFSMIQNEQLNACVKAAEYGRRYLISCIESHTFFDQWHGTSVPPPVERSASPMLAFFTTAALRKSGGVPDAIKSELLGMLSLAKKGNSYGYDDKAPMDADDTAFALRTLIALGEKVTPDMVKSALEPFRCNGSWFTFPVKTISGVTPPFHCNYQGPESTAGPHPEVHLNILALYQEAGQAPVSRVPALPQKNGLPVCYFYDSAFYGAWLFSLLCKEMELEYLPLKSAVLQLRNNNGGWSGRENGFSAVQETALALLTLDTFSTPDASKSAAIAFILGQQQNNGSFPGGTLWNYREAGWYARDVQSIVSTSCAVCALVNEENR